MTEAFSKNFIDYEEYPRSAELQNRCVSMIARMFNARESPFLPHKLRLVDGSSQVFIWDQDLTVTLTSDAIRRRERHGNFLHRFVRGHHVGHAGDEEEVAE